MNALQQEGRALMQTYNAMCSFRAMCFAQKCCVQVTERPNGYEVIWWRPYNG